MTSSQEYKDQIGALPLIFFQKGRELVLSLVHISVWISKVSAEEFSGDKVIKNDHFLM